MFLQGKTFAPFYSLCSSFLVEVYHGIRRVRDLKQVTKLGASLNINISGSWTASRSTSWRTQDQSRECSLAASCCDLATAQMLQHSGRINRFRLCYTFIWVVIGTNHFVDVLLCSLTLWEVIKQY